MNNIFESLLYITPALVILNYWLHCHRVRQSLQSMIRPVLTTNRNEKKIIVIIPFCNELSHLPILLDDLKNMEVPKNLISILLVNDHSTDSGEKYVRNHLPEGNIFRTIDSAYKPGKKNAIQFALDHASSDLFCTLDADVRVPKQWLVNMFDNYNYNEPHLVIGQVVMKSERHWIRRMQFTEWLMLQGLTLSTALANKPVLCNGASLLVDRHSFERIGGYNAHQQWASGDDYYTLLQLKTHGDFSVKIQCDSEHAIEINPIRHWKELLRQRLRWAGKHRLLSDPDIRKWGTLVLSTNLALLYCAVCSPMIPYMTHLYFFLLGIKCMADYPIADWVAKNRNQRLNELDLILLNLLYPFFSLFITILSIFITPKWKHNK
jgi:poly-beta-1,6-N-acetyl-D-glucosamine synthase